MFILRAQHTDVGIYCLRGLQLSLRLSHSLVRIEACLVSILGQLQCLAVSCHGRIKQFFQGVLGPELEVIDSKLGVSTQTSTLQVGCADLRGNGVGAYGVSYAPPKIRFP